MIGSLVFGMRVCASIAVRVAVGLLMTMCRASWGCMPLKAIHSPYACVVRPDSSVLWRSRSAGHLVRWMSTVASTTTQMLRGRIIAGVGGLNGVL